mgnify:CR=1 FL=1
MEYTYDDILKALEEDKDWSIPEDVKKAMIDGSAKSLLHA